MSLHASTRACGPVLTMHAYRSREFSTHRPPLSPLILLTFMFHPLFVLSQNVGTPPTSPLPHTQRDRTAEIEGWLSDAANAHAHAADASEQRVCMIYDRHIIVLVGGWETSMCDNACFCDMLAVLINSCAFVFFQSRHNCEPCVSNAFLVLGILHSARRN